MNKTKKYIIITAVISLLSLAIGAYGTYYLLVEREILAQTVINQLEKEVTVNEHGIADAVDKLYDAVVVVGVHRDNRLVAGGTGFVYKVEGNYAYIITNSHVIQNGGLITVKFTNDETHEVEVVGADEFSDIAVLRLGRDKIISVADLGSSNDARKGDTVFAIGAPLDLIYSWTVTRGILSGKDRLVEINLGGAGSAPNWAMRVLQTDAAINSGNSGGPLANSNGEVIGVTNMKLVASGVEGIGFAIPIEDAIIAANQLTENGTIIRPVLGVVPVDVNNDRELRNAGITIDSTITSGAVIIEVVEGGVAARAGLRVGDVIVALGENPITSSARLRYQLFRYTVGDNTELTFIRGTNRQTVNITLSERAN